MLKKKFHRYPKPRKKTKLKINQSKQKGRIIYALNDYVHNPFSVMDFILRFFTLCFWLKVVPKCNMKILVFPWPTKKETSIIFLITNHPLNFLSDQPTYTSALCATLLLKTFFFFGFHIYISNNMYLWMYPHT